MPKFSTPTHSSRRVVIVGLENKNICRANPVQVFKEIHNLVGNLNGKEKVKNMMILKCENDTQVMKLLELTKLAGIDVKATRYEDNHDFTTKGVIHRIDTQISNEEIAEVLKDQKVIHAKRFMKKINGEIVPTPSVLITFKGKNKSETVNFLYELKRVDNFSPPVPRCHKCQLFGHMKENCKGKLRCVRCGGEHDFEECTQKENRKCFRCGDKHSPAYQGCKIYIEAKQIQKVKLKENITYAQATRVYRTQNNEIVEEASKTISTSDTKENAQKKLKNVGPISNSMASDHESTQQSKIPRPIRVQRNNEGMRERDKESRQGKDSNNKKKDSVNTLMSVAPLDFIMFILFVIRKLPQSENDDQFLESVVPWTYEEMDIHRLGNEFTNR
ncbi:uncharacterized protein LOC129267840 [Lytechinus pictus]|uniref:uncharacterized protein LOC129267840 n=1 Tax=Lytechinus pictus TaxID=7653 RepID=UPI0030BA0502